MKNIFTLSKYKSLIFNKNGWAPNKLYNFPTKYKLYNFPKLFYLPKYNSSRLFHSSIVNFDRVDSVDDNKGVDDIFQVFNVDDNVKEILKTNKLNSMETILPLNEMQLKEMGILPGDRNAIFAGIERLKGDKEHKEFMSNLGHNLVIVSNQYKSFKSPKGIVKDMSEIENNSVTKYQELLHQLEEEGLIEGRSVTTKIRETINRETIMRISKVMRKRKIANNYVTLGNGFNSKCLHGLQGSGKSTGYISVTYLFIYAFPNEKVIAIYQSIESKNFKSLFDCIFHSLKEYLPKIQKIDFLEDGKFSLRKLIILSNKEKIYIQIIVDELDQLYKLDDDAQQRIDFLYEIKYIATEIANCYQFIYISGSSAVFPQLLKKEENSITKDYFLLKNYKDRLPHLNGSKLLTTRLSTDWKINYDNDRKNVALLAEENVALPAEGNEINDEYYLKCLTLCGPNLRRIGRIFQVENPHDKTDHRIDPKYHQLIIDIYSNLRKKNTAIFETLRKDYSIDFNNQNIFGESNKDYSGALDELKKIEPLTANELMEIVGTFIEKKSTLQKIIDFMIKKKKEKTYSQTLILKLQDSHYLECFSTDVDLVYFPPSMLHLHRSVSQMESPQVFESNILDNFFGVNYKYAQRLKEIQDGSAKPDENTREHAYFLTMGYKENQIGYAVNNAIHQIYCILGNNYDHQSAEFFGKKEIKELLESEVSVTTNIQDLVGKELDHWKNVDKVLINSLGISFDREIRIEFLGKYANNKFPSSQELSKIILKKLPPQIIINIFGNMFQKKKKNQK